MKKESKNKKLKKGFTLIEMLVVVLIIGILAGIALPQYQMAVTKAKVASILPLMRRWKDALMEWKLQHGEYDEGGSDSGRPIATELGVSWPSDWECDSTHNLECENDYWHCFANEEGTGYVYCDHGEWSIFMFQSDDLDDEDFRGMIICWVLGDTEGHKVCKALGGKLIPGYDYAYKLY